MSIPFEAAEAVARAAGCVPIDPEATLATWRSTLTSEQYADVRHYEDYLRWWVPPSWMEGGAE